MLYHQMSIPIQQQTDSQPQRCDQGIRTISPPSAMMPCVPMMTLLTRDMMANTAESAKKYQKKGGIFISGFFIQRGCCSYFVKIKCL
jgi:hypothetical protein